MALRINHNIAALNSWWNLTKTDASIQKSLEKLSSGYRINRAGDDPAGLVISEKLRANITGLDQAIKNAEDAISMVQTAEGALTEMHTLLNSIRALALHAANEGANDANAIAADQSQVDSAVDSIDRIANTTKYAGKYLLNGAAGNQATIYNTNAIQSVTVGNYGETGYVTYNITTAAEQARVETLSLVAADATTFTINGVEVTKSNGETLASFVAAINSNSELSDELSASLSGAFVVLTSLNYGSDQHIHLVGTTTYVSNGYQHDAGVDIAGTIAGASATGSGLYLQATTGTYTDLTIQFTASGNTTGEVSSAIYVEQGLLQFVLGSDAATSEVATISISSMRASNLGTSTAGSNGLLTIKSGGTYDLDSDAATAISIIDEAINDVSDQRTALGAFQKNTLESTISNLGVTRENVVASESRIRDVDMAKEMVEFTRLQILMQAGTAMLGQANLNPQSILQLLG